ncbi:MGMT family protein [Candidatus Gottesmanbacteria bacterium]|nr:MGMT family protein [Candidatus Gottesmanbacteria bacterium]
MTFRDRVYQLTKKIPKGKVATYGQIARLSGSPKASRAIGLFMKTNPFAPRVPCHRVVAADGSLTGYSGGDGIPTKKAMLVDEGVFFKKEKVDLSRSRWNV